MNINDIGKVRKCLFCGCPADADMMPLPGRGILCSSCVERIERYADKHRNRNVQNQMGVEDIGQRLQNMSDFVYEVDIDKCYEKKEAKEEKLGGIYVPYPKVIYKQLSEYVSGQEDAKKVVSIAAYNHFKRIKLDDPGIEKSNMLIIGPTGSGKSLMVRTLSKIIGVPCITISATSLTENGYIGDDVETCIELLYEASGCDIEKTQQGIIFIDEIDKLSEVGKSNTGRNVVGRGGVQQALLKLIEGTVTKVKGSKPGRLDGGVSIDTSNILFICGGAFSGIEDIVERRINKNSSMGFGSILSDRAESKEISMKNVTTEDLKEYGMMPEFLGRLASVAVLDNMSIEFLKKVLTEPKNNLIWQYQELFGYDDVELEVEDDAISKIAELAYKEGTGCRGLRKICERVFADMMFELPGGDIEKVIYDGSAVSGERLPEIVKKKESCG